MKVENRAEGDEGGAESQGGRVSMFALLCLTRTSQIRRRVVVEPRMGQHKRTRGQAQASEDRRERTAQHLVWLVVGGWMMGKPPVGKIPGCQFAFY